MAATKLITDQLYYIDAYDFTLNNAVDTDWFVDTQGEEDWQIERNLVIAQLEEYVKAINVYYIDRTNFSDENATSKQLTIQTALLAKFINFLDQYFNENDKNTLELWEIDMDQLLGEFLSQEFKARVFPNMTRNGGWSAFSQAMEREEAQMQESKQSSKLLENYKRFSNPTQI